MSAILTDQFRVASAEIFARSFVSTGSTSNSTNNYYVFLGQPNHRNPLAYGLDSWGEGPSPLDGFEEESQIKETILSLKKVSPDDVRRVVKKINWVAGNTYEMYRHDYTIYNKTPITSQPGLYDSNFYVVNDNLRVYICLQNGSSPDFPRGRPSFDKPDFIDLEPRPAGSSGDGYIWKYLYTIKPSDLYKFDTIEFIPVPENWGTVGESINIKENAIDGKIEIVSIKNRGARYEPISKTYTNIPILGDGVGGKVSITVDSFGKVSDIFVSDGGSGYTKGIVKFHPGAPGISQDLQNSGNFAEFDVIIPPKGGHGHNIYRELGAYRVLIYSRFITDESNPDVILNNDFARVGILRNPTALGSNTELLNKNEVSALKSLKLVGISSQTVYPPDGIIKQTVGVGKTAVGFVASWNSITGVLKYYQPVSLATSEVNYTIHEFTSNPSPGGNLVIVGAVDQGTDLQINTTFTGVSTVINSRTYQLGSEFISGVSPAEYNIKSGEVVYVDNRSAIPRSSNQKEDIKIVLEF
jgi:hypothetical protein